MYLNESLRDGRHDFQVDISGGSVSYKAGFPVYRQRSAPSPWGGPCPVSENVEIYQMDPSIYTFLDISKCLAVSVDGSVNILGTMYEDDFTGATRP